MTSDRSQDAMDSVVPHKLLYAPPMKFPKETWKRGIEGVVVVQFTVDKSGRTENIAVLEAEYGDYFAKTALAMVGDFKYRPRIVNGEPIVVDKVVQRLSFCIPEQRLMPEFVFEHRSQNCDRLHPN